MQTSVSRRVLLRIAPTPAVSMKSWTQLRWLYSDPALSSEIDSVPEEEVVENVAIDLDTFLYGDETSFMSTGMTTELADAMQSSGKRLPTIIQKKCYGVITSRQNVIVGAETGSGKTLAYLLPIIDQILRKSLERDSADVAPIRSYPNAIIVVPNKELCNQVHRMASEVIIHLPKHHEIKIASFTNIVGKWPYAHSKTSPHIAVCTPAFLGNFIKGPNILEEELFGKLETLVLDEADMLLDGSYQIDMEKVLSSLKLVRRRMIKSGALVADVKPVQTIIVAATLPSSGFKSIEGFLSHKFPTAIRITNDHLHTQHPRIEQVFVKVTGQLVMPRRVGLIAKKIKGLHSVGPTSSQAVTLESATFAVSDAELEEPPREKPIQIMVFANTASDAALLAAALRVEGVENVEYHKNVTQPVRQESLRQFRLNEVSVLVCTDQASRGLDLPNVRHVIQAEFATNVVQYLHRVGRASRAGVMGGATNYYDDQSMVLVNSILSQSNIQKSFSRRRGFRSRLKRSLIEYPDRKSDSAAKDVDVDTNFDVDVDGGVVETDGQSRPPIATSVTSV